MKTEDMNNVIDQLNSIENIFPSENWDSNFQYKLHRARLSKSNSVSRFNLLILVLICINGGFIWNSLKTKETDTVVSRNESFKIISDNLLISNN